MIVEGRTVWDRVESLSLDRLFEMTGSISRKVHGRRVQFFVPGVMMYMGDRGKYPTVSITGASCDLNCDHCSGKILKSMIPAETPRRLQEVCRKLDDEGNIGVLLSGGSDAAGALPWSRFLESIAWVKNNTRLNVSIHTGLIDAATAAALKNAGVDDALIDVIGAPETLHQVYHLPESIGLAAMASSLSALAEANIPMTPHIVLGLHYGRMLGEMRALEMVAEHAISTLVVVVLNPMRGTPMSGVRPPDPEDIARFIAAARLRMPGVPIALSCTRPPGRHRVQTDLLALQAGINRIAMPSESAVKKAREMGLHVEFHHTCCSQSF